MNSFKKPSLREFIFIILITTFLLLITRFDYRLDIPDTWNTGDDASYYFHSKTISADFDFNYDNQITSTTGNFIRDDGRPVPYHPIGVGILSSPFMLFGNFIEKISIESNIYPKPHYFLYSLSAIFYFFVTIFILQKILIKKNNNPVFMYLLFFGSGATYYAFERYSMTVVYEIFSVAFLMYIASRLEDNKKSTLFFVGYLPFIFLSIRWTNYYFVLIPIFYLLITDKVNLIKKVLTNINFYIGNLFGLMSFLLHTKVVYGFYALNPSKVYNQGILNPYDQQVFQIFNSTQDFFDTLILMFNTLFLTIFSQEFGLIYFTFPVFLFVVSPIYFLAKKEFNLFFISSLMISVNFMVIVLWQSAASGYGFRYLFSYIPLGILLIYKLFDEKTIKILSLSLGLLGFVGFLLFETTVATSLSQGINVFGTEQGFTQPKYLSGLVGSIFQFSSYLVIFATSYLGIIILKILSALFNKEDLLTYLEVFSNDTEKIKYFFQISSDYDWQNLIILIFFYIAISHYLIKNYYKIKNKSI
jgi:preprotein translocase subunit Sss1